MKKLKVNPYQHTKSQIAKHSRPEIAQKTVNRNRTNSLKIINNLQAVNSILCIGARHDSEVQDFIDAGYDCLGIDIATETDLILNIDAHDMSSLPRFDLVYASHSLKHMHDPIKVLKNIRKIARVGLLAILPITTSQLKYGQPVIFDMMVNPPDVYTGDPDFKVLEPYEIAHYEKDNVEITVLFRYA